MDKNTRSYISCFRISGMPILPPILNEEEKEQIQNLKNQAVKVENRLKEKKNACCKGLEIMKMNREELEEGSSTCSLSTAKTIITQNLKRSHDSFVLSEPSEVFLTHRQFDSNHHEPLVDDMISEESAVSDNDINFLNFENNYADNIHDDENSENNNDPDSNSYKYSSNETLIINKHGNSDDDDDLDIDSENGTTNSSNYYTNNTEKVNFSTEISNKNNNSNKCLNNSKCIGKQSTFLLSLFHNEVCSHLNSLESANDGIKPDNLEIGFNQIQNNIFKILPDKCKGNELNCSKNSNINADVCVEKIEEKSDGNRGTNKTVFEEPDISQNLFSELTKKLSSQSPYTVYNELCENLKLKHKNELMDLIDKQRTEFAQLLNLFETLSFQLKTSPVEINRLNDDFDISNISNENERIPDPANNYNCDTIVLENEKFSVQNVSQFVRYCDSELCSENFFAISEKIIVQPVCETSGIFFDKNEQEQDETVRRHLAAIKITAAAKGYLTRRLFKTKRVTSLVSTVKDCLITAMLLQEENDYPTLADINLETMLLKQLTSVCNELQSIFLLPAKERMAIIAADRKALFAAALRLKISKSSVFNIICDTRCSLHY